jgi:hypothetical protein
MLYSGRVVVLPPRSNDTSMALPRIGTPILASLMRERPVALSITGFALTQVILVANHLPGWPCPLLSLFGVPCPGCGLSRAIGAMVRGDWSTMITFHAFAPLFGIALVLIAIAAFLPDPHRRGLYALVELVERRTGATALLLVALLLYWAARLATDPSTFIALIRS